MMDDYFEAEPMTRLDKGLFALAAYKPPDQRARREAAQARRASCNWTRTSGSTTSRLIAARRIGAETVTYVRNIYKYYLAYKLMEEQGLLKNASDQVPAANGKTGAQQRKPPTSADRSGAALQCVALVIAELPRPRGRREVRGRAPAG
jgi:hypothetical protein